MSMKVITIVLALVVAGCAQATDQKISRAVELRTALKTEAAPSRQTYLNVRAEVEDALHRELKLFYPGCVDKEQGGFTHALPADWAKLQPQQRSKNAVYQTRMTWTAAEVAKRRPELREEYLQYARHGFDFLKNKMWDREQGGFFWQVDSAGNMMPEMTDKHSYGQAFGIYTCATVYQATKDPAALALAMEAFRWLDEKGHDRRNGGYFEAY